MNKEEVRRRLDSMQADYRAKAPAKVAEIEALWLSAKTAGPADPVQRALCLEVHTLVGSAPTLGCEALGAAARELESALNAAFGRSVEALTSEETHAIDRLVKRLAQSLA